MTLALAYWPWIVVSVLWFVTVVVCIFLFFLFFFFKQKTAYEMRISDWSSDVCSSDLQRLDANAVFARLVITGLVREDHAGFERDRGAAAGVARLGDPRRAFVDREVRADAVAGAVREIETGFPQGPPREAIELSAVGAARKQRGIERDIALEHAGEAVLHLVGRFAHGQHAGDVGGAVFILATRIDQIQEIGRAHV